MYSGAFCPSVHAGAPRSVEGGKTQRPSERMLLSAKRSVSNKYVTRVPILEDSMACVRWSLHALLAVEQLENGDG